MRKKVARKRKRQREIVIVALNSIITGFQCPINCTSYNMHEGTQLDTHTQNTHKTELYCVCFFPYVQELWGKV